MALVPSGEFIMGSDKSSPDEGPERRVNLRAFAMDFTEVTRADYKRFVKEADHRRPKDWVLYGWREELADHPVVFVSLGDARSYCKWAGKRLPTEDEWEKAARGIGGNIYPWGSDFDPARANTSLTGIVGTTQVKDFEEGKSPYGLYDMAGNVWEWTDSDFSETSKVVRGGSWGLTHRFARAFTRIGYAPDTRTNNLGFRCARDG